MLPLAACRSYAKGFAYFGMVYSFNECMIERYRAKHDKLNPALAGCATGAIMAYGGACGRLDLHSFAHAQASHHSCAPPTADVLLCLDAAAGPGAMCFGCASVGAFSVAIEHFLGL